MNSTVLAGIYKTFTCDDTAHPSDLQPRAAITQPPSDSAWWFVHEIAQPDFRGLLLPAACALYLLVARTVAVC
jgi:hypothetical protein